MNFENLEPIDWSKIHEAPVGEVSVKYTQWNSLDRIEISLVKNPHTLSTLEFAHYVTKYIEIGYKNHGKLIEKSDGSIIQILTMKFER